MSIGELRLLSSLEIAALLMVPCGLWLCGKRKSPAVADSISEVEIVRPYRLGGMDLGMGLMLYALMALLSFGAKWWTLYHPVDVGTGDRTVNAMMVWTQFFFVQGTLLAIVWAWFRVRHSSMKEVFGMTRLGFFKTLRYAALCILPAGVIATLSLVLMLRLLQTLGWPMEQQEAVSLLAGANTVGVQIALAFVACLGAPVVEEVLFRGVLFGSLRQMTNRWFAAIVSALLFGIIHLHVPSLPALCLLGFFFALAYEFTGSLTVSIVMHAIFNSVQVIIAMLHGGK